MDSKVIDIILQGFSILVTPSQQNSENTSDNLLIVLEQNTKEFDKFMKENAILFDIWNNNTLTSCINDLNSDWKFASTCLKLLDIFQDILKKASREFDSASSRKDLTPSQAPALSPDTLSFNQQKHLLTSLQFIVCLIVCPNLQNGVGIPVSKRTGFSSLLMSLTAKNKSSSIDPSEAEVKLLMCAKVFVSCLDVPSIAVLLLSRHLNDLLALLLQLNYQSKKSSLKQKSEKEAQTTSAAGNDTGNSDVKLQSSLSSKSGEFCEAALKHLVNNIKPSMLVRELIVLQGGPKSKKPGLLAPAPSWLRQVCGNLLSDILKKPDGVLHIIHGVVGNDVSVAPSSLTDWRKCDVAAKIISHCPQNTGSMEQYYFLIAPQILRLLQDSNVEKMRMYLRVCCSIIKEMSIQNEQLTFKYILNPIMEPLLVCLHAHGNTKNYGSSDKVLITEDRLRNCIGDLHKVFVSGGEPCSSLTKVIKVIIHPLFVLYTFCVKRSLSLKSKCEELLVIYFKHLEQKQALDNLIGLAYKWNEDDSEQRLNLQVRFESSEKGGVRITKHELNLPFDDQEDRIECLKLLLNHFQSDGLAGEFLIHLLKELTNIIREQTGNVPVNQFDRQVEEEESLLEIDYRQRKELEIFNRRLLILNLIAALSGTLDSTCMQSNQQTLEFVKATLERGVEICKHTDDEVFTLFESETITMAMGLLTAIMANSTKVPSAEDKCKMEELVPLLNELSLYHPEEEIRDMATDLRIAVATRGIVLSELIKKKADEKNNMVSGQQEEKKPLIEVLPDKENKPELSKVKGLFSKHLTSAIADQSNNPSDVDISKMQISEHPEIKASQSHKILTDTFETKNPNSKLQKVFEELCHPEIPIRGHALLSLTKLIESRDSETKEHQDAIIKILEQNLAHADTYLYLPSVNGLVAMATILPDIVVPRLCDEYTRITAGVKAENKVKVGEALVKTSRMLGDMLPKYKWTLLPAILSAVKDKDMLVRASSLSNLTELCRLLQFSLGSHIHEIISCCSHILQYDPEDEVRKAAALVFSHLLQGVGTDVFQVLDSGLKDLYRVLKLVYTTETNSIVKDHVNLALNQLDDIMREVLFPKQTLTKKIKVLSAD